MKKYLFLPLSIICIAQYSFAQKEAWNWHFGQFAALNFSTGTPVAMTNSVLQNDEGVASISDSNGRLLFYTNGLSVYDSTNTQMPNGFGLLGHPSSSQSSVIVKKPNSNSLYYLFTVDYAQGQNGFAYSIVDMSLNNGRGDILTKNVLVRALVREKLTAVRHSNGTDFWILVNDWTDDNMYAYQLSSTGLSTTPVISNVGPFHNHNDNNTLGYMKVNRQNNKIALAQWAKRTFELVDFNNTTGLCSNHITIQGEIRSYGVEFSPDGTKLYATTHYGQTNKLIQFNLNLPNASAIYNSRTDVATSNNERYFSALQIAPNGKIYCSLYQQQFLGVINNPDSLGFACNYVDNGVGLSGKSGNFGLPNFVYDYALPLRVCPSITPSVTMPICGSTNGSITVNATGGTTFQYSLDSINFVNSNQFTGLSAGQYTVYVKNETGCVSSKQVNLTCTPPTACAESKRANVWYFGHGAGLDFNTNPPTVLTNGRINTLEGVASISDSLGRLLFYTDGITVWNKNHQVMSNGTDLLGNPSATQSGVIVPFPNNSNLYYIFTTDAVENGYRNGFRYSIVDIRLNNGLGNVTIKNQLLLPNATERICAVKHKNNCDIWVITQDKVNNMNVSFLVTSNGVETNRVLSPIGINTNDSDYGYIKPSFDGKQIACAFSRNNTICVYKFNNSTGILSDVKILASQNLINNYGVEFSPNGNLLYISLLGPSGIVQINLLAGSISQIIASQVQLASSSIQHFYGALQTTPTGEIYVTNAYWWGQPPQSSSIGIVRNPNVLGVGCNFQDQAIRFDPVKTSLGFPNFIQSYFAPTKPKITGETTTCASTTKTYKLAAIRSCNTTVQWRVLDNNATIQNPTDTSVYVLLPASGQVRLVATVSDVCTSEKDTLIINVGAAITVTPSVTMPICGSTNGSITVNATGGTNLQYSLDSIRFTNSNQFTGLAAGQYTVYVKNETGCTGTKQVTISCTQIDTSCSAQLPNPREFNTAANGINAVYRIGALDPNWYVAVGDRSLPTSPFKQATVVGNCEPAYWYNSPYPNANWISYDFGNAAGACNHEPQGCIDLYFRRQIILPAKNECCIPIERGFCLGLDFFADNSVYEILINGVSNFKDSLNSDPYNSWGFQNPKTVNLCNGWKAGVNNLIVHVKSCPRSQGFLAQANVSLTKKFYHQITVSKSICQGQNYEGYSISGIYTDTSRNVNGCDTIRTLNLTVLPSVSNRLTANVCQGERYLGYSNSGIYSDTFRSINGCDSIRILSLNVRPLPVVTNSINLASCNKTNGSINLNVNSGTAPYTFQWSNGATTQNISNLSSANYKVTITDFNGCQKIDSVSVGNIPTPSVSATTIAATCEQANGSITVLATGGTTVQFSKDSVNFSSNNRFTGLKAGQFRLFVKNEACDTVINVVITNTGRKDTTILFKNTCDSTKAPRQTEVFQNLSACDSVVITNWRYIPQQIIRQNLIICESEVVRVGDSIYTKSGNYRTILRGYLGCDSVVLTNLTVVPRRVKTIDTTICANQSLSVNNKTYRLAGTYRDTIRRSSPFCDSILIITLKTKTLFYRSQDVTFCKRDSYVLYGKTYKQAGVFVDTFRFPNTCDSVITTTIKVIDLQLTIPNRLELRQGDSIQLTPQYAPNNSLKWDWSPKNKSLNCWNCPNPIIKPSQRTLFQVMVKDTVFDCIEKAEIIVEVKDCEVFIPNIFSPNGDLQNDLFTVYQSPCAKSIKSMQIYDRWGNLVFTKINMDWKDAGWDGRFRGRELPPDVYAYFVEIELNDGSIELFKGDVTLVR